MFKTLSLQVRNYCVREMGSEKHVLYLVSDPSIPKIALIL